MDKENENEKIVLNDNIELLLDMTNDQEKQKDIYMPGVYWLKMVKNSLNEIKIHGISSFRGTTNAIGQSCSDNSAIDTRSKYNTNVIRRIIKWITTLFPLSRIFKSQILLTKSYADQSNIFAQEFISLSPKVKELLKKYTMPYSTLGNCYLKVILNNQEQSLHYLTLLEQHDNITQHIDFNKVHSVFEIGGGFGINIHLLLENYPTIKKILYLDIPPHLYLGTQYLKAFYGDSVIDYTNTKELKELKFSKNDNLEIICIAPWQIEYFKDSIDVFMNSHSFVEMPRNIVQNYANKVNNFPKSENTTIALVSYDRFSANTINPSELPTFFKNKKFTSFEMPSLLDSSRKNFYYISSK